MSVHIGIIYNRKNRAEESGSSTALLVLAAYLLSSCIFFILRGSLSLLINKNHLNKNHLEICAINVMSISHHLSWIYHYFILDFLNCFKI